MTRLIEHMVPMTRLQAGQAGHYKYWSGTPCKYKHYAPRYTSNGACSECQRLQNSKYSNKLKGDMVEVTISINYRGKQQLLDTARTINDSYEQMTQRPGPVPVRADIPTPPMPTALPQPLPPEMVFQGPKRMIKDIARNRITTVPATYDDVSNSDVMQTYNANNGVLP